MPLTNAQYTTLKTDILADPVLSVLAANGAVGQISAAYNTVVSPPFVVFKSNVTTDEVGKAVNYIAVEAMTTANQDRIKTFYQMNPVQFEPRLDIRTFWTNTFSGALGGQGQATRDALEALWRRNATRAEKLFATGTGTTGSPATLTFEGTISDGDVETALRS